MGEYELFGPDIEMEIVNPDKRGPPEDYRVVQGIPVLILCGGQGSRLWPITSVVPKALMPLHGKPLVCHVIDYLRTCNLTNLVFCIDSQFRDQFQYQLTTYLGRINFPVHDTQDMGTAGSIMKGMVGQPDDEFMIYYADILTEMNLEEFIDTHNRLKMTPAGDLDDRYLGTLAVSKHLRSEKGVVRYGNERVTEFEEKPNLDVPNWSGIALFTDYIFPFIKPGDDISLDVLPKALKAQARIGVYEFDEDYEDVGSIAAYRRAESFKK